MAFRAYGLPLVLRSDNRPPFASRALGGLSRLSVKLIKAGVLPERIDPGKPQPNGRHERLHLTLKQDTASPPARSLAAQQRRFDEFQRTYNTAEPMKRPSSARRQARPRAAPPGAKAKGPDGPARRLREPRRVHSWARRYNEERPHEALADNTPASRYRASDRAYSGRLRSPDYLDHHEVRRVRTNGEIKWHGRRVFISEVLQGEPVSLEPHDDGQWLVCFGPIELGILDHKGRFHKPRLWT